MYKNPTNYLELISEVLDNVDRCQIVVLVAGYREISQFRELFATRAFGFPSNRLCAPKGVVYFATPADLLDTVCGMEVTLLCNPHNILLTSEITSRLRIGGAVVPENFPIKLPALI